MKQIKTLLAALFVAMAGTASAQTNYVHITLNDNSVVHYSQDDIKSMIIDTKAPEELKFVSFNDGTNTVKVAKMNLGATSIADGTSCYGDYYAWGATEPFGTVSYTAYYAGTVTPTTGHDGGYTQDNAPYWDKDASAYTKYTSASTLEAADDAVAANMPGYHMPTLAEMKTLFAACGGSHTPTEISSNQEDYPSTGIYWVKGGDAAVKIDNDTYSVNGMLFVQDADHHVFFPEAGRVDGNGTTLSYAGRIGCYWSSSLRTGSTGYPDSMYFISTAVNPGSSALRYYGFPVRPFKDAE